MINKQPSPQTVEEGQSATFTVFATGSGTLSYQWQKDTVDISGATSSGYTTPVTTMADDGAQFRCVVTNAGGGVTSTPAALTVNMLPPVITTHPAPQTVDEGQSATFSVTKKPIDRPYEPEFFGSTRL